MKISCKINVSINAYIFLILAQVMVGINIVGSKYLISSIPILFLLAMRFFLATIILYFLHWFKNGRKNDLRYHLGQLSKIEWVFILAQALCAGVLFNCLMLLGLRYTDANMAGIITSALPAIIAIISWIILKEKFSPKKSLCVAFAILGLLVINIDKLQTLTPNHSIIGDLIVFFALIPEASYYILTKLRPNSLPILLVSSLLNGINAIILVPIMLCQIEWQTLYLSSFAWLILFTVSLSSGLFYVFWYAGSNKVDGLMASLSTAVMPIATVVIAWLTLRESITTLQLIGMSFVIISIFTYALPLRSLTKNSGLQIKFANKKEKISPKI